MSFTHEYEFDGVEVAVVTKHERWWGRPLLWLAERLTDLAYLGAVETTEKVDGPFPTHPHFTYNHYGTSEGDRLPQPCAIEGCDCDDVVEEEGESDG